MIRLTDDARVRAEIVLDAIAEQTSVACVFDASVAQAVRARRLSFAVQYVTGYEALSALAYALGLDVVVVADTAVLVSPETLPEGWSALATEQLRAAVKRRDGSEDNWRRRLARSARLVLQDVTLTTALRRIGEAYRIDIRPSDILRLRQELVSFPDDDLTLDAALTRLARLLGAQVQCHRGVVWLVERDDRPTEDVSDASPRVDVVTMSDDPVQGTTGPSTCLERMVNVTPALRTRAAWLTSLGERSGVTITGHGSGNVSSARYAAQGRLGDVLEATRLIWGDPWRVVESRSETGWEVRLLPE
jgi:hypothetical protein